MFDLISETGKNLAVGVRRGEKWEERQSGNYL